MLQQLSSTWDDPRNQPIQAVELNCLELSEFYLLNVYIISLNPHTNPMGHIIVTAANITYVISIPILQMREPRHREGKELPKIVNC